MPDPSRRDLPPARPTWGLTMNDVTAIVRAIVRLAAIFRGTANRARVESPADVADGGIGELFRERRGDVIVTATGRIVKVLPDDACTDDGTGAHQRLLIDVGDRLTVKLSHNLAFGRVPASVGQRITFHGEYAYNDLGGAVHWTHADPKRWHEDGWIELDGRRYG